MSQTGTLHLIATQATDEESALRSLLDYAAPLRVFRASRVLPSLNDPEDAGIELLPIESDPTCYLRHLAKSSELAIDCLGNNSLSPRVQSAIEECIPEAIRGLFLPARLVLRGGPHSIQAAELGSNTSQEHRTRVSISLLGHSTPLDSRQFDEKLMSCDDFRIITDEIARLVGPLVVAVSYYY